MIAMIILCCLVVIGSFYVFYYHRWKCLWSTEPAFQAYRIDKHSDDILRVVMIGDSWAGIHAEEGMDAFLQSKLEQLTNKSVFVKSKGKGGAKTRAIYRFIFDSGEFGTKSILSSGPDYCIVIAGINDAASNLGVKQYCHYFRQIIDFLLLNNIRTVIVEIPDVNIWHLYGEKPLKDLAVDFVKSTMTNCKMYSYSEYREALHRMITDYYPENSIIFVQMAGWNGRSPAIDERLFLDDQIHLNKLGYQKLDTSIALAIAKDLK